MNWGSKPTTWQPRSKGIAEIPLWIYQRIHLFIWTLTPIYICTWFLTLSGLIFWVWWNGFFFSKIELHFVGYTGSKNLVQTRKKIQCFKLEIVKNQVQIYRGLSKVQFNMYIEVFFVSITLSSNNTVGVVKYLWNDHFVT